MRGKQSIRFAMDYNLRRRGIALGVAGVAILFGSAIAVLLTPVELIPYLLAPMVVGLVFLVAAYLTMRQAERAVLESKSPTLQDK